jgi:hypothetical protein
MPLKLRLIATCFGLNKAIFIQLFTNLNWCSAAVLIGEQLREDGPVRLKHVAIECHFNEILK